MAWESIELDVGSDRGVEDEEDDKSDEDEDGEDDEDDEVDDSVRFLSKLVSLFSVRL